MQSEGMVEPIPMQIRETTFKTHAIWVEAAYLQEAVAVADPETQGRILHELTAEPPKPSDNVQSLPRPVAGDFAAGAAAMLEAIKVKKYDALRDGQLDLSRFDLNGVAVAAHGVVHGVSAPIGFAKPPAPGTPVALSPTVCCPHCGTARIKIGPPMPHGGRACACRNCFQRWMQAP